MLILLFLLSLAFRIRAQPLCTFAYSPCLPQDVTTGVCVDAPGEQCYIDVTLVVYCCVPPPVGSLTTTAPAPAPAFCPPVFTASKPFTGICADILPCCDAALCSTYSDAMQTVCPVTCGFCQGGVTPTAMSLMSCSDELTTCSQQKSLCNSSMHKELLKAKCPYSCGYCDKCVDNSRNCANWAKNGFCTSKTYTEAHVRSFCANTCGFCGNGTCVDRDISCPIWKKNGYCKSIYYTTAQKRQYCGRSCNLC